MRILFLVPGGVNEFNSAEQEHEMVVNSKDMKGDEPKAFGVPG